MVTIPNLNWKEQTSTPSSEEYENEQLLGCVGCAVDSLNTPAPTPPPGTVFMFRGSSLCITHLLRERDDIRRLGVGRTLT